MTKPFDVSTLMENIDEEIAKDTHDSNRPELSPFISPKRHDGGKDRRSSATGSKDTTEAIQETRNPDIAEDSINPAHYRRHPSGIECIEVTRHMNFNTGNAVKYIWRYMDKGDPIENLKKAQWYIDDEIRRLQGLR